MGKEKNLSWSQDLFTLCLYLYFLWFHSF
uniref:Uncharacterized protein n=1 Tax=Anguilla anguilla TaxID=7936 RepID=A0A0E9QY87_ANGAN